MYNSRHIVSFNLIIRTISKEEIADFFEKLKSEGGKTSKDEEEEINQLISGVDDDEDEEVFDGGEREEGEEDISEEQEKDEEDEAYFERIAEELNEEDEKTQKESGSRIKVTKALVARWVKKIKATNSVQPLYHLILCFRSGLKKDSNQEKKKGEPEIPYFVPDSSTFSRVLMACVKCLGDVATALTKYDHGS